MKNRHQTSSVKVKLYGNLQQRRTRGHCSSWFDLKDDMTIEQLLEYIGVPATEVWMIFVNGEHVEPRYFLKAGDEIHLLPPLGGG